MTQHRQSITKNQGPVLAILFRAKVKPGKRQEFIDFLKWDFQECKKEEGTLRFDAWVDPGDDDAVYVYEAYKDEAAFAKHQEGEPFQQWSSQVEPKWITEKWTLFVGEPLCLLNKQEGDTGSVFNDR
jgi:quinol monooxygenase YgiN